jgi:hypothetical protein
MEYSEEEKRMRAFYNSLSEKDRRHYAALEAARIGYGGITYISMLLGCDEKTIKRGISELDDKKSMSQAHIRKSGGGRKSKLEEYENIDKDFLEVLKKYTAGDPMDEKVKWTNLKRREISELMLKKGIDISRNLVSKLLKRHGYVKRKALRKKSTGEHVDRDKQFKKINKLRKQYENSSNPIVSVDAKKKELIGNLHRDGYLESTETVEVYDHDYRSLADEKVTPYAVYDLKNNECFVNLGRSDDTSDFACDSIKIWWNTIGKKRFPNATSILILADGGGSNSSKHHVFKESLQHLSNELNLELRMAHYPPYTSKWNPIEHRVFPHITNSLSGVILLNIVLMKELIKKTKTKTGLKVFARISRKIYEKGKSIADNFYEKANIKFDNFLGQWNYLIKPNSSKQDVIS